MIKTKRSCLALTLSVVLYIPATFATEYELIDLGILDEEDSSAFGINNSGHVVGTRFYVAKSSRGFFWDGAAFTEYVSSAGWQSIQVDGLNNLDQIIGNYVVDPDGTSKGFLTGANSPLIAFDGLGGESSSGEASVAASINDAGIVVGSAYPVEDGNSFFARAIVWDSSQNMTEIHPGPCWDQSRAIDVNNQGQILVATASIEECEGQGKASYLWDNGHFTNLSSLDSGVTRLGVSAINDQGAMVGSAYDGADFRGWFWSEPTGPVLVDSPDTRLVDVNNHGQAVGHKSSSSTPGSPFIWSAQDGLQDLSSLGVFPGWELMDVSEINDNGQIVGTGRVRVIYESGVGQLQDRAFLLSPLSDSDVDGIPDNRDNCPDIPNADQSDVDGDAIGDICDVCRFDADNDLDGDEMCGDVDNCPVNSNPDQADLDQDGLGDVCDNDADGDGSMFPGPDCNDLDATIFPRACDIKRDGIDQNCDGVDRTGGKPCTPEGAIGKEQYCADGIDNDGDGAVDCADPDCYKKKVCK